MNRIKEKIKSGGVAVGTWMQIPSANVSEMVARQGFDFCAADLEHTEIDNRELSNIYRGLKGSGCQCAVRVASNRLMYIRKPLDLGATLLIVPLVNNASDAKKAVSCAKYPPQGVRGFAFCRANNWGLDFDEYVEKANDELMILVMIESAEAVENIQEILDVEGVDGVLVGPYDLSGSYGIAGQTQNGVVKKALEKVVSACIKKGKIAGQHIVTPDKNKVNEAIQQGYKLLALGIDSLFIMNGLMECKGFID